MNPWKPIDTAPKDGTPILVGGYQPEWEAVTVYWTQYPHRMGGWYLVETGAYADDGEPQLKITHWTEIPTPPPQPQ